MSFSFKEPPWGLNEGFAERKILFNVFFAQFQCKMRIIWEHKFNSTHTHPFIPKDNSSNTDSHLHLFPCTPRCNINPTNTLIQQKPSNPIKLDSSYYFMLYSHPQITYLYTS